MWPNNIANKETTVEQQLQPISCMSVFMYFCVSFCEHILKTRFQILQYFQYLLRDGWAFRVSTWNVDSLTGRLGELVEALAERRMDVLCVQETT